MPEPALRGGQSVSNAAHRVDGQEGKGRNGMQKPSKRGLAGGTWSLARSVMGEAYCRREPSPSFLRFWRVTRWVYQGQTQLGGETGPWDSGSGAMGAPAIVNP